MQTINYGRVVLGALIAGAVLVAGQIAVIGTLGPTILAAREAAHMPAYVSRPVLSVLELVLTSLLLIWLYAAIRPRFGPGIVTAIRSGVALWVSLGLIVTIHTVADNFGLPSSLLIEIAAGMLVVIVVASIAGSWVYRE